MVVSLNYYIPTESYKLCCFDSGQADIASPYIDRIGDQTDVMQVSHSVLIYCFQDSLQDVNVTIPFPLRGWAQPVEPTEWTEHLMIRTGRVQDIALHQFSNQTVLTITFSEPIHAGHDLQFALEYYVRGAVSQSSPTFWDRQLGRGSNWRVAFRPPFQQATTNEINVDLLVPGGFLIKGWSPSFGQRILDRQGSSIGMGWRVVNPGGERPEFWVIFGKGGASKNTFFLLLGAGMLCLVVIIGVAFLIRKRYGPGHL